jgi:hypothetical protein
MVLENDKICAVYQWSYRFHMKERKNKIKNSKLQNDTLKTKGS